MDIKTTDQNTNSLPTDIAALAIWNSKGMAWVTDEDIYFDDFNNVFEEGNPKCTDACLIVETGGDGQFKMILKKNEGPSPEEQKNIYKEGGAFTLKVGSDVYIGSPEWVGYSQERAIKQDLIDRVVDIEHGEYIVEVYSLLTRDENGNPQFIQFLFCLFEKANYNGKYVPENFSKSLKLKYERE